MLSTVIVFGSLPRQGVLFAVEEDEKAGWIHFDSGILLRLCRSRGMPYVRRNECANVEHWISLLG